MEHSSRKWSVKLTASFKTIHSVAPTASLGSSTSNRDWNIMGMNTTGGMLEKRRFV